MDFNKFLDELGATGEDRTAVESFFTKNPTAAEKVNGWRENGLRQSDYDRKMNLLKAEVDADKARIKVAEQTIIDSRDTINSQYLQALQDKEAAENRLAATNSRINRVATEYNVPIEQFTIDVAQPQSQSQAQPQTRQQPQNDPQYARREDLGQVLDITKKMPFIQIQINKLQREYHDLTGQYFDDEALFNKSLELNKPLPEVADLLFGLSAKKQEAHDNKIRQEAIAANDAQWNKKISQNEVNPIRTDLAVKPGPVFQLTTPQPVQGQPGRRPDRLQSGVEGAVAAFREGKYRPQGQTA